MGVHARIAVTARVIALRKRHGRLIRYMPIRGYRCRISNALSGLSLDRAGACPGSDIERVEAET